MMCRFSPSDKFCLLFKWNKDSQTIVSPCPCHMLRLYVNCIWPTETTAMCLWCGRSCHETGWKSYPDLVQNELGHVMSYIVRIAVAIACIGEMLCLYSSRVLYIFLFPLWDHPAALLMFFNFCFQCLGTLWNKKYTISGSQSHFALAVAEISRYEWCICADTVNFTETLILHCDALNHFGIDTVGTQVSLLHTWKLYVMFWWVLRSWGIMGCCQICLRTTLAPVGTSVDGLW